MKKFIQIVTHKKHGWLFLLGLLIGINRIASLFYFRLDLTKEKRYTLGKASINLLKETIQPIEVTVFLKGEFPSGFRKLANSTEDFLRLLKEQRNAKFNYHFVSPTDDAGNGVAWGDSLTQLGAMNINLTVQKKSGQSSNIIFPVALIKYNGKQALVNLFPGASRTISQVELNTAEALMEYQFVSALDKLVHPEMPGIAYAIGHGEPVDERTYMLRLALSKEHDLRTLDLTKLPSIPSAVKLLMIVKPTEKFSDADKLKIDQFVMRGGKLLCFIDNLHAEMDSFARKPDMVAYDRNIGLTDLLFKYGIRINTDLVMDLRCEVNYLQVGGTAEAPQNEFLPWNYFPLAASPEGKNILQTPGYIGLKFANSIDTIQVPGIVKTPLLVSSEKSRTIATPALVSLNENRIEPDDKVFRKQNIPMAMLLSGKFPSLFSNRMPRNVLDSMASAGAPYKNESVDNKIIIVSDGDLVLNDYVPVIKEDGTIDESAPLQPIEMGWNKYTYLEYVLGRDAGKFFIPVANKDFLLNTVEYLISNPEISETRNKEITLRLLDANQVKEEKTKWQFVNIGLPVLLIVLFGWLWQLWRKKKYAF